MSDGDANKQVHEDHIHPEPTTWLRKYVFSTDHKVVGKQYLFTALFFLVIGGGFALLMRWQLAFPGVKVPILGDYFCRLSFLNDYGKITSEGYNQLVTMHGLIMVFFVIIPLIVGGFGNFLIPLHIGARDVAMPLLNMLSYWLYFVAGVFALASLVEPAQGGWTAYPPLNAIATATPGSFGTSCILFAIFLLGFSSILGGLNFLVSIVILRAPGMTWSRMPLVTWAQLITAVFQLLATPVLAGGLMLLFSDHAFNTSFFVPKYTMINKVLLDKSGGGQPLLFQHVFWFYAHPAVYILILPSMGMASEILTTFSRKPIFGYKAMVVSMSLIMGLGFMVWGHHMFQSGMSPMLGKTFMMSTMLIALPSAIKVFNWLGTIWGGQIRFTAAMLCGLSFVSMFIIGGLSGIFMAATPVDIYIHDTYYIVAHFHYIVFGGTLFASFGGIYYWFPKLFGRMMSEPLGKIHWFLTFVFFNLAFFPMHLLGEAGHMRRVAEPSYYEFLQPVQGINIMISVCVFFLAGSQIFFIVNFFWSMIAGKPAPSNPWGANSLEWQTPAPLPYYNFDKIPVVHHGPYEYNHPDRNSDKDFIPQTEAHG